MSCGSLSTCRKLEVKKPNKETKKKKKKQSNIVDNVYYENQIRKPQGEYG